MTPAGSTKPLIYILGEAPGGDEDTKGVPFVGKAGRVLRFRIPEDELPDLRWNNCIRTRPPENRDPTPVEIECCRPSIIRDIEATKPLAIFGFGNVPLQWALQQSRITIWNGRKVPVKIGEHTCWFFPMMHPSYIMRTRKFSPRDQKDYGSEVEFTFAMDLKRAFKEVPDLPEPVVHTVEEALSDLELITGAGGDKDVRRIVQLLREIEAAKLVGLDYETNGKRPYTKGAKILTVAISTNTKTFAFPLEHRSAQWTETQLDTVWKAFRVFLFHAEGRKVSHNLAFEQEWSAFFFGKKVLRAGLWGDSMGQAFILDERMGGHSLDFLCLQYFGLRIKDISGLDRTNLDAETLLDVLCYNAVDAKYHRLLYKKQAAEIARQNLAPVYEHHLRRIPTMVLTQMKGVPVDQQVVNKFHKKFSKALVDIEAKIQAFPEAAKFKQVVGHTFRPSANKDVDLLLKKVLHIFEDSTDETILLKIKHPIAKLLLQWRENAKLLSTYVKPVMTGSPHIHPDGLMHPVIHLVRTRTWRTSSEDPNSQNWPKREHKEIRSQIRPGLGEKVVSFDYGQIQARNVAMESKDPALVKAFWDRYDIHTDWMHRIVKLHPQWVPGGAKALADKKLAKKFRDRAKNELVFPSFFGAQGKSIAKYLEIPERIGEQLSDKFWEMFPDIHGWHERCHKFYRKHGYITGLSGFRRHAPISPNELINAPIQGDEAIIVCSAMVRLSELEEPQYQANMEIHDDLTFIWPTRRIEKYAETVVREMLKVDFPWINVPLVVEMSVGDDWASGQEIGVFSSDNWNGKIPAPVTDTGGTNQKGQRQ